MKVWFTADTHFNHPNCLLFRKGFSSVEEMNEALIYNWNDRVSPGDSVYHLGDFALGRPADALAIIKRLKGQIYLVRGNHEKVAEHSLLASHFVWIKDYKYLKIQDEKIVLSHYPFRVWRNSHHGSWHLHGHSHGSLAPCEGKFMDVGVDCCNFSPVSLDEVREYMGTRTYKAEDHHYGRPSNG